MRIPRRLSSSTTASASAAAFSPTVDPDGTGFLSGYDVIFPGRCGCSRTAAQWSALRARTLAVRTQRVGELHLQPAGLLHHDGGLARRAGGNLAFAGEHTDSFHNFQGFIHSPFSGTAEVAVSRDQHRPGGRAVWDPEALSGRRRREATEGGGSSALRGQLQLLALLEASAVTVRICDTEVPTEVPAARPARAPPLPGSDGAW